MQRGIDVSAYQAKVNWHMVAQSGITFSFIKATEGDKWKNKFFAEQWSGALYAGLKRGAYHFMRASSTAQAQADHFLRVYPGGGELPTVIDIEYALDGTAPLPDECLAWIEIVTRETGVRPMVYAGPAFADEHKFGNYTELSKSHLWIAHYGARVPRVPRPWSRWRFWQWTGTGRCPGVNGDCDLNYEAT